MVKVNIGVSVFWDEVVLSGNSYRTATREGEVVKVSGDLVLVENNWRKRWIHRMRLKIKR